MANAAIPASTAYSVNIPVIFDGRSKYFDYEFPYPQQLEGVLSPSEFLNIGKLLKSAVETASEAEHRAWVDRVAWRTTVGRRFLLVCTMFCAAAIVCLLYLFLGTSERRSLSFHHLVDPLFIVGVISIIVAVILAAAGSLLLRRASRSLRWCECGVRRRYLDFRTRVEDAFADGITQMNDSLQVRRINVRRRMIRGPGLKALPRISSQSIGGRDHGNRVVPIDDNADLESGMASNTWSGTHGQSFIDEEHDRVVSSVNDITSDTLYSKPVEWIEIQPPPVAVRPVVVPADPSLRVHSSPADVAADAKALRQAAKLMFSDRIPEAAEILDTIVFPGLDASLDGVTIRPLRLVGVAMLSHAYSRYAPLFRGKQFKFYPATSLTREIRKHLSLVAPALSFLDNELPLMGNYDDVQAVFCYIRASITFNTATASSPFDFEAALPFYDRAASAGYDFAESVIAMYYKNGWAGLPKDPVRACDMWRHLSAVTGRKSACRTYGECLLKGEGTRTDFTLGIRLIREAAEWGDPPAMVHMGEMAMDEKNVAVAVEYLRLACRTGLARAQFLYARLLDAGTTEGVEHDDHAALELFRYAAMQDDKDARRVLEEKQLASKRSKKLLRSKSGPGPGRASDGTQIDGQAGGGGGEGSNGPSPRHHQLQAMRNAVSEHAVGSSGANIRGRAGDGGELDAVVLAGGAGSRAPHRPSVGSTASNTGTPEASTSSKRRSSAVVIPTVIVASATPTNTSLHGLHDVSPSGGSASGAPQQDELQRRRSRVGSAFKSGSGVKKRSQSSQDPTVLSIDSLSGSTPSSGRRVMDAVLAAGDITDGNESELGFQ